MPKTMYMLLELVP